MRTIQASGQDIRALAEVRRVRIHVWIFSKMVSIGVQSYAGIKKTGIGSRAVVS